MNRNELISIMNQYVEGYSAWGGAYLNWDLPKGLTGIATIKGNSTVSMGKLPKGEVNFKQIHLCYGFTEEFDSVTFYEGDSREYGYWGTVNLSDVILIQII